MGSDHDASDSSSEATEEQISISLLPERKRRTKKKFSGTSFSLHMREMCCRKAVVYGGVTTLLLLLVVFLAAITRASSASGTVNTKDEERYRYDSLSKNNDRYETTDEDSKSLRLPRDLLPIEYLVYLHPNLTTFKFTGKVDILLSCEENTDHIVLHVGKDMKVKNVEVAEVSEVKSVKELTVEKFTRDLDREMIFIKPNEILEKKKLYFVLIEFESKLSTGLAGFYLSSYTSDSGEKRYLATTHFEPTDARKAFPCFDEPDMKATFEIVIAREKRHVALANMPRKRTEKCGNKDDLCIDHFEKSVKMSTYLVAFVVCDYSNITNTTKRGTQVGVWAPPDQISQGKFALDVAVQVLTYYEELFHVPYPLPKQDLIAIPDFAAGAMENWGLITYRLTSLLYDENESSDSNKQWVAVVVAHELAHQVMRLCADLIAIPDFPTGAMENWGLITYRMTSILYDPNKSSGGNKQWVAVVVAHELAHQWFGNLVTMKWWNDLWLNEGFASFMENLGVDKVYPEWKMMEQFLIDKTQLALALDQLSSSHAIKQEVLDPAQINSLFDTISYDKGASIIRMLEEVLGRELFFKGLQVYLQKYKFSNAETDDLWQCLADVVKGVRKGVDVREMMDTWTTQMGFPVITVSSRGGLVTAKQKRFLIYHNDTVDDEADDYLWVVPLSYITEQVKDKRVVLMKKRFQDLVDIGIPGQMGWIKMNADQTGYYRVNYDRNNWQLLTKQLNENHEKLSAADRAGLLDDAFKLARANMLDYEVALCLTPYLEKETEYVPWMSALSNLAYIATQFSTRDSVTGSDDYRIYKLYLLKLLRHIAEELGWNETKGEPHLQKYLRASVLKVVAEYDDDSELVNEGHKMFKKWLAGKEVPPNLRNTVYAVGLKHASRGVWNEAFQKYQHETVPSEQRKLMYALTNSRDETILKKLLSFSLDNNKIRSQDSVAVINSIAQNPSGRKMAWDFTKRNYKTLFKRYGESSFDFSRLIKATTSHFNTEDKLKEVKTFFSGRDVGSGELAVNQTLESIAANIRWISQHREYVVAWLADFSDEICPFKPSRSNQRYYDMRRRYGRP